MNKLLTFLLLFSCININAQNTILYSDFNDATVGTNSIIDSMWSISTSTSYRWRVDKGYTSSSNTGPSSGYGGAGNYVFTEASCSSCDGAITELSSDTISFTGVSNPNLVFYYHNNTTKCRSFS